MSHPSEQHKDPSLQQFEVDLTDDDAYEKEELGLPAESATPAVPSVCGLPLKYVSCVSVFHTAVRSPPRSRAPADVRPAQTGHSGRTECRADPHHALLARVCRARAHLLRSGGGPTHGAPQGLHIARRRLHEA